MKQGSNPLINIIPKSAFSDYCKQPFPVAFRVASPKNSYPYLHVLPEIVICSGPADAVYEIFKIRQAKHGIKSFNAFKVGITHAIEINLKFLSQNSLSSILKSPVEITREKYITIEDFEIIKSSFLSLISDEPTTVPRLSVRQACNHFFNLHKSLTNGNNNPKTEQSRISVNSRSH